MCFSKLVNLKVKLCRYYLILPKSINLERLGLIPEVVQHIMINEQPIAFFICPNIRRGYTHIVFVQPLEDKKYCLLGFILVDQILLADFHHDIP